MNKYHLLFAALGVPAIALAVQASTLATSFPVGTAIAAAAQDRAGPPQAVPPPFVSALRRADTQLASIESGFNQLQRAPAARGDALADAFDAQQRGYAENMIAQYSEALNQTRRFNQTNGRDGTIAGLKLFEDLAVRHEAKLKVLADRARAAGSASGGASRAIPPAVADVRQSGGVLDSIAGFFIPQANAAIALRVYTICNQQPRNQAACAAAIAQGVIDGNAARATFNRCWASHEGVRPKKLRAFYRSLCTAALVVRLA